MTNVNEKLNQECDRLLSYIASVQNFTGLGNAQELMNLVPLRYEMDSKDTELVEKFDEVCANFNPFNSVRAIDGFYSDHPNEVPNVEELISMLVFADQVPVEGFEERDLVSNCVGNRIITLARNGIFNKQYSYDDKDPLLNLLRSLKQHVLAPKSSSSKAVPKPVKSIDLYFGFFLSKVGGIDKYIKEQDAKNNGVQSYVFDNEGEIRLINNLRKRFSSSSDESLASIFYYADQVVSFINSRSGKTVDIDGSLERMDDYKIRFLGKNSQSSKKDPQ